MLQDIFSLDNRSLWVYTHIIKSQEVTNMTQLFPNELSQKAFEIYSDTDRQLTEGMNREEMIDFFEELAKEEDT